MPTDFAAALAFPRDYPLAFAWMDRPFDDLVARRLHDPAARAAIDALKGYISDGRSASPAPRWSRCSAIISTAASIPRADPAGSPTRW